MIAYRIQDKSRGVEHLIDLYDEDYTLTYDQLVERLRNGSRIIAEVTPKWG